MSLNCNEINLILEELNLEGSFIQNIIQPGYDTIAFYTYKNEAKTILICTANNVCRINSTNRKITKNDKPLRFMEFLKSNIKGSKIISCKQLGLERIIKFVLLHDDKTFVMYVRLWSGAGNIIICDEKNIILDSMYRRPSKNEITGGVFIPPVINNLKRDDRSIRTFCEIEKQYYAENQNEHILSYNEKVDLWYSEYAKSLSKESLLLQAEKWYSATKTKREASLEKLQAKLESFNNATLYKHQGDLILSFAHLIDGKSDYIECEDYDTGSTVRIKIDSKKTANENAFMFYEKYRKAKSGAIQLKHDIEIAKSQIVLLDKLYDEIKNEENPVIIEQKLRHNSTPLQQKKKNHPGLDFSINGWYMLVGRDANENDELLRHHVRGEDMWIHTRDFPGGYVFIKSQKAKVIPNEILIYAANLAIYYSKARKNGKADLYYTKVKYLRRIKNGKKGLVLPSQEKNIFVQLDQKKLDMLDMISKN